MRYLCLIYLDEQELAAIPTQAASDLNAAHWTVNGGTVIREGGGAALA